MIYLLYLYSLNYSYILILIILIKILVFALYSYFKTFLYTFRTTGELNNLKSKSKSLPQQAEVAQGVAGRLRPRIILTFRHYKGNRSSAKCTDRLYPRRNPWYSLSEAESTSGHMVLSGEPRKKSPVTPPGIDPGTIRLVPQRLNHYATPGPS